MVMNHRAHIRSISMMWIPIAAAAAAAAAAAVA